MCLSWLKHFLYCRSNRPVFTLRAHWTIFSSLGLKWTTDDVNLIDKVWVKYCFQSNVVYEKGRETDVEFVDICYFKVPLLQSVIFFPEVIVMPCKWSPVHMTAGLVIFLLPSMSLLTTQEIFWKTADLAHGLLLETMGCLFLMYVVLRHTHWKKKN